MEAMVNAANDIKIKGKSDISEVDKCLKLMSRAEEHVYDIAVNEMEAELVVDSMKVNVELVRTKFHAAYKRNKEQEKR